MFEITLLCIAVACILGILMIWFFQKRNTVNREERLPDQGQQGARRRQLGANRQGALRQRGGHRNDEDDGDVDNNSSIDIQLPEGKVGAKKLAKLQAKAERKTQREADERDRQEKKKLQEIEDEERKKTEEKVKADEKKREEEEKRIREEKERQEYEEYLKLKEAFTVESEGFDEEVVEGENALQDFVNHIKKNKVVVIEDIAALFKLKTQQAIDRIQQLQADGIITGVIDDRGKFIYISRDELSAVAKFVKQRGRVSIAELVDNSNQLINLSPTLTIS